MFNFIIDSGNTNIKISIFIGLEKISNFSNSSEAEAIDWLKKNKISKSSKCIISSVRNHSSEFISFLQENSNYTEFSPKLKLPLKISYHTSETLGSDRLAAACGAVKMFPSTNLLIIDAGSAITYDIVTADSYFLGGNISPGIGMRFKALHEYTDKLPLIEYPLHFRNNGLYDFYFGKDTTSAIFLGVVNGIVHEIESVISVAHKQYHGIKVVFTGGDCIYLEKLLKFSIFAVSDLVTLGLNEILNLNE